MKNIYYIILISTYTGLFISSEVCAQPEEVRDSTEACSNAGSGRLEVFHAHYILYSKPPALKLIRTSSLEQAPSEPGSEEKQIIAAPSQGGKVSISINGLENQEITISVYNIIGKRVFTATFIKDSPDIISVSLDKQFEPGIYFITGSSGNRLLKQQKLMIN